MFSHLDEILLVALAVALVSLVLNLITWLFLKSGSPRLYWGINVLLLPVAAFAFFVFRRIAIKLPDCGAEAECIEQYIYRKQVFSTDILMVLTPLVLIPILSVVTFIFRRYLIRA